MSYYQTTARVERITDTGEHKKVSEKYLVNALSCTEAIARTTGEVQPASIGEFEIVECKKTPIMEAMGDLPAEKYFLAKVNFIQQNELTGRERKTLSQWFIGAKDYDSAKAVVTEVIDRSVGNIEIAGLVESPIVGFIPVKL